jgi:iron(III) transport system ATP-binding protein
MSFLEVKGVIKRNADRTAVDTVFFEQQQFEKLAIAGETGSGKTSLLKMIGGLMQADAGEIFFENKKVAGPLDQLIPGHKQIAYLSQHFELRNNYRVHELLEMADKMEPGEANKIVTVCEIEHLLQRKTNELSGGEKQRIVLAMQLVKKPKLLLLDEPFSNLDAIHERTMKQVIQNVSEQFSTSCIMVSHDGTDVLSWADTIYIVKDGKIVQQGSPEQIYKKPQNEYCAGLFGDYNVIDEALQKKLGTHREFIRPEEFMFTGETDGNVKGNIRSILFYGSYYLFDIETQYCTVRISSMQKTSNTGDAVFFRLRY